MAAHDRGSTMDRGELPETNMSIMKKLACMLTLGACAGWALVDATWTPDRESASLPQAGPGSSTDAYMLPMQSFWSVLATGSAR
jgi:hypothetical protein